MKAPRSMPLRERLFRRVIKQQGEDGCWEWTGAKYANGYGHFYIDNIDYRVHRASWMVHYGAIPVGMFVCHRCDNKLCIRPDHLFIGDKSANMQDMVSKGRQSIISKANVREAKLTSEVVKSIREWHSNGTKQSDIARAFELSPVTIHEIVRNKKWKEII